MALGLLCQSKKQITFGTHTHTNWHINWQHSCSGLLYGSRKQMQFGLAKDTYFVSARCKYSLRSIAIPQNVAFIKAATETKPFQTNHFTPSASPWSSSKSCCAFLNIWYIYTVMIFFHSSDLLLYSMHRHTPSTPLIYPSYLIIGNRSTQQLSCRFLHLFYLFPFAWAGFLICLNYYYFNLTFLALLRAFIIYIQTCMSIPMYTYIYIYVYICPIP